MFKLTRRRNETDYVNVKQKKKANFLIHPMLYLQEQVAASALEEEEAAEEEGKIGDGAKN